MRFAYSLAYNVLRLVGFRLHLIRTENKKNKLTIADLYHIMSSTFHPKHGTIKSKTSCCCPKKLLVQEKETQLRKQEKLPPERESVKLHQEKVLEERPEEKVLEEQPQGDLLEGEDARTSSFFILF